MHAERQPRPQAEVVHHAGRRASAPAAGQPHLERQAQRACQAGPSLRQEAGRERQRIQIPARDAGRDARVTTLAARPSSSSSSSSRRQGMAEPASAASAACMTPCSQTALLKSRGAHTPAAASEVRCGSMLSSPLHTRSTPLSRASLSLAGWPATCRSTSPSTAASPKGHRPAAAPAQHTLSTRPHDADLARQPHRRGLLAADAQACGCTLCAHTSPAVRACAEGRLSCSGRCKLQALQTGQPAGNQRAGSVGSRTVSSQHCQADSTQHCLARAVYGC